MLRFLAATLLPAALLCAGAVLGGWWTLIALVSMTGFVAGMDRLTRAEGRAGPLVTILPVTLALLQFPLWALAIAALAQGWPGGWVERLVLFSAFGVWFGQVGNSVAHELVHSPRRWKARLGAAVYVTMLHGHHASAHRLVHHVHVATAKDPNSARLGEGFWAYLRRASIGEFREGLRAENRRRSRLSKGLHPYAWYLGGGLAVLMAAALIGGGAGVLWALALAGYGQMQLFLSDYVQHYGLVRKTDAEGRLEPVGPRHSWNAPHWYSSAMMLNAPRHSDHHIRPGRDFAALELEPETMPMLPQSLPVMASIALFPPWWRRIMDRRVARWQFCPAPRPAGLRPTPEAGLQTPAE